MKQVTQMYICESKHLVLHTGQPYIFSAHPTCEECQELASYTEVKDEWVIPFTSYDVVLKLRRIAQFLYDEGLAGYDDWVIYMQANCSVESLLEENYE